LTGDITEAATGLQKPFPHMITRPDNPTTPAKIALGRLLFFDPVLSNDNRTSCAHCHHPELGFSDGRARAMGYGGEGVGTVREGGMVLPRHSPRLWNTLYNQRQYWDGRAKDLEDQAQFPITDQNEMKQDRETLMAELNALPEYKVLFDKAFGGTNGSGITFQHVQYAIGCYERTFLANNTPFDRYAAGNMTALSASEKRGLKLFLSTKARCAECHGLPNFANPDFKVIGVPDVPGLPADPHKDTAAPGRGGGPDTAFKIPTLRNAAIAPPYMHNGSLKNLDEVLDFYSKGGGRGKGLTVPLQDDKIRKYTLTVQERTDLKAFLFALTDLSSLPELPKQVPSGLPVVPRLASSPTSHLYTGSYAASLVTKPHVSAGKGGAKQVRSVDVMPGQSIQDGVELAGRGGVVRVHPGIYHESVLVINHDVSIVGVKVGSTRPVLDGENKQFDAVIAMGNRFSIQGLEIGNYQGNGVVVRGAKQATFRDLVVTNPGDYAVYPVECDGVLIENCKVEGSKDAGLYVGQSRNIIVRNNEVHHNVAGIEIENSINSVVEGNYVHDNTGGILVFVLPFNISKECHDTKVIRNRVIHNNLPNFAADNAFVKNVLAGTGIMVLAADRTEIAENEIVDNGSFGIAVTGLTTVFPPKTNFDVDATPDETWIHDNTMRDNARSPDDRLKRYLVPPKDLIWDLGGKGNRWNQPGASSFPPKLPG
jgi:cytochrome c peroxidase